MFQRNDGHRQQALFDGGSLLPERLRERLETSWADTFYREVFCRIDEEIFADLYSGKASSGKASRPNVPVNLLVALEILKSEFGWSDRDLYDELCFNLQVRRAVGMTDLGEEVFRVRTLYNFRKRVRQHAEQTGENLFAKVFEQVTDAQLKAVGVETEKQRMDSTQVLSNVADQSRLELIIAVVQQVWEEVSEDIEEQEREKWAERLSSYIEDRPHEVSYQISVEEVEAHLRRLGEHLVGLVELLRRVAPESEAYELAKRVLKEQYVQEEPRGEPSKERAQGGTSLEGPTQEEPIQEESDVDEPQAGPPVEVGSEEEASEKEGAGDGSGEGLEEGPAGIQPRPAEQISAESLQSPHDPDATYRQKGVEKSIRADT